jgi:ribosomal protein S18 acetylase RimI-like enzyme
MSPLSLRTVSQLSAHEVEQLAGVLVAVVEQGASVGFLPPLSRASAADYWRGVIEPGVILVVAEREGTIVGTAQLHLAMRPNGRHRAEVAKVLVHPNVQRQGIGRALMRELEQIARAERRTLLILDTREGDGSNDLYRKLGYTVAGSIPGFARSATGQLDATVFYYKQLAP